MLKWIKILYLFLSSILQCWHLWTYLFFLPQFQIYHIILFRISFAIYITMMIIPTWIKVLNFPAHSIITKVSKPFVVPRIPQYELITVHTKWETGNNLRGLHAGMQPWYHRTMLMLKQKWPEDVYFNGITVISQDRNWLTTPHIANVEFLIKKKVSN